MIDFNLISISLFFVASVVGAVVCGLVYRNLKKQLKQENNSKQPPPIKVFYASMPTENIVYPRILVDNKEVEAPISFTASNKFKYIGIAFAFIVGAVMYLFFSGVLH